jgi:hypothetical protein
MNTNVQDLSRIVPDLSRICPGFVPGFVQDCPGLSRIVQECPGLSRIVQDCPGLSRIVQDCPGLSRIVQDCLGLSRICPGFVQDLFRICPGYSTFLLVMRQAMRKSKMNTNSSAFSIFCLFFRFAGANACKRDLVSESFSLLLHSPQYVYAKSLS